MKIHAARPSSVASEETRFAAALFDPALEPPPLRSWNGSDPVQRFAVYRNNVIVALIDALGDTFPALRAVVGESNFRALARASLQQDLPRSPVLAEFGKRFPDFVASFAPAAQIPGLADLARLEFARVEAFHAADAQPLSPSELAPLLADVARLPMLRLGLHPSLRLIPSAHAIVDQWATHASTGESPGPVHGQAQTALVLRHGLEVEVYALAAADAAFVAALLAGAPLGEAVNRAGEAGFDFAPILGLLLRAQAVCRAYFDVEQDT